MIIDFNGDGKLGQIMTAMCESDCHVIMKRSG